jgi:hypothetical protein
MPKPCFLCGFKGHTVRDCPNQQCHKCRLPGHRFAQCPNRPWPDRTCYRCLDKNSHMPYDCPCAVTPKGAAAAPAPKEWVSPLLSRAWGGVGGKRDMWQASATLTNRLGTGGGGRKKKLHQGTDKGAGPFGGGSSTSNAWKQATAAAGQVVKGRKFEGNYTRLDNDNDSGGWGGGDNVGRPGPNSKAQKRLRDAGDFHRERSFSSPGSKGSGPDDGEYEGRRKRQKMR